MYLHSPTLLGSGHPEEEEDGGEEEEETESLSPVVGTVPYPLPSAHASLTPKECRAAPL